MGYHALVFGASGILGWAVVEQILKGYPKPGVFSKVTAVCNSPLTKETSLWPEGAPKLAVVDGVDLRKGTVEDMIETLGERVPDIGTVTHLYYFAFVMDPDLATESEINVGMVKRGVGAVDALAPELRYVVVPTGTMRYGVHMANRPFKAPYREEMCDDRKPWMEEIFYFQRFDWLSQFQLGKKWNFCDVCCAPVVGYTPHKNQYNLPGIYMNYLSVYKFMHEQGHPAAASKEVPFPSPAGSWNSLWNDGGQDMFAKFSIHISLEQKYNREVYNIADSDKPYSMADRWPVVCSFFGLVGKPPLDENDPEFRMPVDFLEKHSDMVKRLEVEKGVRMQEISLAKGLQVWMERFTANHHLSLDKVRATGFKEQETFEDSWKTAFDKYVAAKRAYYGA